MRDIVEKVKNIFAQTPPDWQAVEKLMTDGNFSKEELAYLSISMTDDCFCEYRYCCHENKQVEFENFYYEIEELPQPTYSCYGNWKMHIYLKEANYIEPYKKVLNKEVATWE